MASVRERFVVSGVGPDQVRLHLLEQGDPANPTVVLVHGYPDDAGVWDGVADALEQAFHVVRYDVRGMGQSSPPAARSGYELPHLTGDLVTVVRAVSPDQPVHLVGHDWGSIQSWEAVTDPAYAPLFASYTTMSGPCLAHAAHWMRDRLTRPTPANVAAVANQLLHSWYIGAFQLPVLPEILWRLVLAKTLRRPVSDGVRGLELYRANMFRGSAASEARRTTVPVQQIVPTRDRYVTPALVADTGRWCDRFWQRDIPAEHWAPATRPKVIARWIAEFVDHLGGAPAARGLARAAGGGRPHEHQLVLITGAGSGIGRATALAFARDGATVLATDIDGFAAQRTAAEASAIGVPAVGYGLDVADSAAVHALAQRVRDEHGVPDVVVANAGIGVAGSFLDTTEDDWRRVVDVNLWGVVHTLRAFAPQLVERGEGGHLVITASAAAFIPSNALPAYATTKAAVLHLGNCLGVELASAGVGVSVICPGFVNTNIARTTTFSGLSPDEQQARQDAAVRFYQRRNFGPEKVATAVLRAVRTNRSVVPVTAEAKLGYALTRLSPGLLRALGRIGDPKR